LKEFEKAADEYKQGALIESLPVFDLALGQCYRMLHRPDDAIWYYERFIKYGRPTGNVLKGVEDLIALMRAELEKKATAPVSTEAAPTPAQRVPPTATASSPSPTTETTGLTFQHRERWYQDRLGWGLVGAGLVAAGVAGYLFSGASDLHAEANATLSHMRRNELHDQADRRKVIGDVVGAGGVALLVTAAVKLAIHPGDHASPSVSWGLAISSQGVRFFCKCLTQSHSEQAESIDCPLSGHRHFILGRLT